jgi:hypothetical protein
MGALGRTFFFLAMEMGGVGDGASNGVSGGSTLCSSAGGVTRGTLCSGTGGATSGSELLGGRGRGAAGLGKAVARLRIWAIWM